MRSLKTPGKNALALILAAAMAATIPAPEVRAEQGIERFSQLKAIYLADPTAPWFETWVTANLKPREWLYRPDIRMKAGADLVAAVADDPTGIGLLTHGELSRLQAAGAPQVAASASGVSICAALVGNAIGNTQNFGDFALKGDAIEVMATSDTLAIAEALIDAYRFKDRMTVTHVKADFTMAELPPEKTTLAVLPVLPQTQLDGAQHGAGLRPIAMSEAAIEALRSRGLDPGVYRTSLLQHLPLIGGIPTVCDPIVLITSADKPAAAPEVIKVSASPWTNPFAGSDFARRVFQSLEALKSLWEKSSQAKG